MKAQRYPAPPELFKSVYDIACFRLYSRKTIYSNITGWGLLFRKRIKRYQKTCFLYRKRSKEIYTYQDNVKTLSNADIQVYDENTAKVKDISFKKEISLLMKREAIKLPIFWRTAAYG